MTLRRALRSGVAAACIVGVSAPAVLGAGSALAASPLVVRTGQGQDFSHVEFRWTGGAKMSTRRDGQVLTVAFSRDAKPDMAELQAMPPRWVKAAEARHVGGHLEIAFTLADGAEAKIGNGDGAPYVNFFKAPDAAGASAPEPVAPQPEAPARNRPNPLPASGVVKVSTDKSAGANVGLNFDFIAPAGAAVFRRGEAIWIVFDAAAKLDIGAVPKSGDVYSRIEALRGEGWSALRIVAPDSTLATAQSQGARWSVSLGPRSANRFDAVSLGRDETANPPSLSAVLAGASQAVEITDPAVGDRLFVAPALGPAKGVLARHEYVDAVVLPSTQGLAVEARAGDLAMHVAGDLVQIGRPKGLALSPASAETLADAQGSGDLGPASSPAGISQDWGKTGPHGFLAQYNALLDAASAERVKGTPGTPPSHKAQMTLARFLIGHELSFEAIGVLNAAARADETIMGDAEFRGLRGAARMMAGRYTEAETDLSVPILSDDPSASLWRSLVAVRAGRWEEARTKFAAGQRTFNDFSPVWRARFARAAAQAALELGDYAAAGDSMAVALQQDAPPEEQLETRLVQAQLFQAMGDKKRALNVFKAIATAPVEKVAAPATLYASQLELETGAITPTQAAAAYGQVRFRWRGDSTELQTVRALGNLYLTQGRYREGLEALRSAGKQLPDLPEAVLLQNDLYGAFRNLFLDGAADGLQPIQALALFYDFKDMTPVGADGDQMVRNLVRRLVDVDLLDQAADLLKYQVDNRLDGIPKAQVSTDLATIYLMARKPEAALDAINSSRSTLLPPALNAERRIITARAMMSLGRMDAAVELVDNDPSKDAQDIRAEAAWKGKTWPAAGGLYEKALGDRYKSPAILTADEESKLLRAGVAYSLADDDASLARLRGRYQGFIDGSRNPDALRVALAGVSEGGIGRADFSRTTADSTAFAGWVQKMKQRFRDKPAPLGPSSVKQADAKPAGGGAKA